MGPGNLICLEIPTSRNYYVDAIFANGKSPLVLQKSQSDILGVKTKTTCIEMGSLERLGYKYFYIIMRKNPESNSEESEEKDQNAADLYIHFRGLQECNSMALGSSF